jgi:hypothetical protein
MRVKNKNMIMMVTGKIRTGRRKIGRVGKEGRTDRINTNVLYSKVQNKFFTYFSLF